MIAFTPMLDPSTGDLVLDDGMVVGADSVALGHVLWTLRTPRGACLVAPTFGVDWSLARLDVPGADVALRRELERALRWIVDAGSMTDLAVRVTREGRGRLRWEVSFTPAEAPGTTTEVRGTRR